MKNDPNSIRLKSFFPLPLFSCVDGITIRQWTQSNPIPTVLFSNHTSNRPIMIKTSSRLRKLLGLAQVESPLEFGCLAVLKTRLTWMWNKWSRKVALDTFGGTISRPGSNVSQWHPDTKRHKDFFLPWEWAWIYVYWLIRKLALWNCFPVQSLGR